MAPAAAGEMQVLGKGCTRSLHQTFCGVQRISGGFGSFLHGR